MTNQKIKELFLKKVQENHFWQSIDLWPEYNFCTKEEFYLFKNYFNSLSEEKVLKYIEIDNSVLSLISTQSNNLCKKSVEISSYCIQYIKEQTVDLCLIALEKNQHIYPYIRIVRNTNYEITLENLKEKKAILDYFM